MRYLWALAVLVLGVGGPAHADWPTTEWVILERADKGDPQGERARIADKYRILLEYGSRWYQSMSFNAPHQLRETKFFRKGRYVGLLKQDTSDNVSAHGSSAKVGNMYLSSYPGFMKPETQVDQLLQAAAIHELFHAVQTGNPAYLAYVLSAPAAPPDCDKGETVDDWLTEGSASAVQVMYLEKATKRFHPHTFKVKGAPSAKGPPRVVWARNFDQPLHVPRLQARHFEDSNGGSARTGRSWQCSYGTWYFWYAVGNMLGGHNPENPNRIAYLRYVFEQKGPWQGSGLALVDSGLKRAAEELNAVRAYRGGLYALYPQFVAQYLDEDEFHEKIETFTMPVPSSYATSNLQSGTHPGSGLLEPIAMRAWRFKVQLPPDTTSMPHTVRFSLDASDPATLAGLHLIVNHEVIDRPVGPNIPYSHTRRTDDGIPNEQGELEYFVQIANVAPDADATLPADFTLRVDVESFSSTETEPSLEPPVLNVPQPQTPRQSLKMQTKPESEPSDTVIVAGLPPGFEVHGPGRWACVGSDDARGSFTIMTPDGRADQLERMLPQALKNLENDLNRAEIRAHAVGEEELERVQQDREAFETGMQQLLEDSGAEKDIALAVDESRRGNETLIMARLYGRNADGDCNVEFTATLPGRQPAAQQLAGDQFSVSVTPESMNVARAGLQSFVQALDPSIFDFSNVTEANAEIKAQQMEQLRQQLSGNFVMPDAEWTDCGSSTRGCNAGTLTLEHAGYDHLSGTFTFGVYRSNDMDESKEYAEVTGFINITSSQVEGDNTLLDFMSRGKRVGEMFHLPGAEGLLQGGSMFRD